MSYNNYCLIMKCLDIIETELNNIAEHVGHPTFDEFIKGKSYE
ncbi:MAG: hypothetical protein SwBeaBPW_41800 [Shewanella algae]